MMRILLFLVASVVANAASPSHAAEGRVEFAPEGDFSETAIRRGVKATKTQCEGLHNAVWVSTPDHGEECLKYWTAGFPGSVAGRAVVFFHGDVWVGPGKTSKGYLRTSEWSIQRDAEKWSRMLGAPYVFFGRPGAFGSSGDHMQRRREGESILISAALDLIKDRLKIKEFVIAGQSGGGHVTSALLTRRADIICAVPTSAPSSPRVRWLIKGLKKDTTGYGDSYEPAEHLGNARVHEKLRVFVLGDPDDANVVWPSQTAMADSLKAKGIPVETLHGKGTGPDSHSLSDSARIVASWCYQDLSTEGILRKAAEGLRG
jgi:hypothetical protein